jgi:hypothetical protein
MPNKLLLLGAGRRRRGFLPTQISGCIMALDAERESTIVGNTVAQWSDFSGNNNHPVEATEGNKPVIALDANGKKVISFVSSDKLNKNPLAIAQPMTMIMVTKMNAASAGSFVAGTASVFYRNGANKWEIFAGTSRPSVENADLNPHIFEVVLDGASSIVVRDGNTIIGPISPGAAGFDMIKLGFNVAETVPLNGYIAELYIYNRTLTSGERTTIRQYLSTKRGIAVV